LIGGGMTESGNTPRDRQITTRKGMRRTSLPPSSIEQARSERDSV